MTALPRLLSRYSLASILASLPSKLPSILEPWHYFPALVRIFAPNSSYALVPDTESMHANIHRQDLIKPQRKSCAKSM